MFAKFFIDRPIFAWVIALVILLGGALALRSLPVAQYPAVAPPALSVSVTYPGASAQVIEETAVALLEQRSTALMRNYLSLAGWRIFGRSTPVPYEAPMLPPLPPVELPPWIHKGEGTSWYLKADNGSVFLFDAGPPDIVPAFDRLRRDKLISNVEAVWISHYHDDHVESVNWFRFMAGARVYAQQELVDVLANPRAYALPALPSQPVRVDHSLRDGDTISWKGFKLTSYHFPGQTLYHGGLLIEHAGLRVFHVGDSFDNWGIADHARPIRNHCVNGKASLVHLGLGE